MKNKLYKTLFLGISATVVASASYALISPKDTVVSSNSNPSTIALAQPLSSTDIVNAPTVEQAIQPELVSITHKIKSGDSLSSIFSKLNLNHSDLHSITHTNKLGKQFATISVGKNLFFITDTKGKLQQLSYKKNQLDTLKALRTDNGFEIEMVSKMTEKRIVNAQTTINTSLFQDGKEAGLSDKLIMQLAEIFAWDIDFALSLRKGDQFTVVYEKILLEDKVINTGNIISAEFINRGHSFVAVKFEDSIGNISYFTPEGKSMRKAFLRSPVDFARISSRFNLKRKHPVLNRIRAHKGVDYAARTGTPIKSTGDGRIVYRGRKGGYGRVVIVKHGQKYSTLYAHLSSYRKGQKTGSRIKQGQVIGYVGRSGLATGSHLHYEFRVNGAHRNPLTVKLPHAKPIKSSLLAAFKVQTQPLVEQLNKVKARTLLARNQ
ncbi:MAG: peptidoglycan DD-metalloendopeptidase family protein [Methylococcales bacterium]|nr:peptidoglycan DD-metalloendopeptidase family protein [Methylococcales bacterium]